MIYGILAINIFVEISLYPYEDLVFKDFIIFLMFTVEVTVLKVEL
jgi:hypothetical protein